MVLVLTFVLAVGRHPIHPNMVQVGVADTQAQGPDYPESVGRAGQVIFAPVHRADIIGPALVLHIQEDLAQKPVRKIFGIGDVVVLGAQAEGAHDIEHVAWPAQEISSVIVRIQIPSLAFIEYTILEH